MTMPTTVESKMEKIRTVLVSEGCAPDISLSITRLPASLWKEYGIKQTPVMRKLVKEAEKQHRPLNNVLTTCWNLCVVASGYPIVHGGVYCMTAMEACNKMLRMVRQLIRQNGYAARKDRHNDAK